MSRSYLFTSLLVAVPLVPATYLASKRYELVVTTDPRLQLQMSRDSLTRVGGDLLRTAPNGTHIVGLRGYEIVGSHFTEAGRNLELRFLKSPRDLEFRTVAAAASNHKHIDHPTWQDVYELINPEIIADVLADSGVTSNDPREEPERLGGVRVVVDGDEVFKAFSASVPEEEKTLAGEPIVTWSAQLEGGNGIADFQSGLGESQWLSFNMLSDDSRFALGPRDDSSKPLYSTPRYFFTRPSLDVGETTRSREEESFKCSKPTERNETAIVIRVIPVVTPAAQRELGGARQLSSFLDKQEDFIDRALAKSNLTYRVDILSPALFDPTLLGFDNDQELVVDLVSAKWELELKPRNPEAAIVNALTRKAYSHLLERREDAEADLAVVLVEAYVGPDTRNLDGNLNAWASRIPADAARFFALVDVRTPDLGPANVLAHEIGHLFGGRHNIEMPGESVPPENAPANHGFIFTLPTDANREIGTLTSVGATRLPIFSGLDLPTCEGVRLGVARVADQGPMLAATLPRIANLYETHREQLMAFSIPRTFADARVCHTLLSHTTATARSCDGDTCKLSLWPFVSGQDDINDEMKSHIEGLIGNLREVLLGQALKFRTPSIVIAGYADRQGSDDSNVALAYRRATSVYKYIDSILGANHGIPMFTCAYGESRSVQDLAEPENFPEDRRVEVHVVGMT